MTEEERDGLASALDDFLRPYLYCCGYTQTFDHLHRYCRGLLSDLKRKNTEPIALASGCAVRTLQEFLRDHQWRHAQILMRVRRGRYLLLVNDSIASLASASPAPVSSQ